jgi:heme o synthase
MSTATGLQDKFKNVSTTQWLSLTFFKDLFEFAKPRLALLVLVTVLSGIYCAGGELLAFSTWKTVFLIFLVVYGATTLNCYLERDIDGKMERTKNRSLPAGRLPSWFALVFGSFLLLISIPAIYLEINTLTGHLAVLAFLSYVIAYTPMKTRSSLALFVGAIPGALPPLMGFVAVRGFPDHFGTYLFMILFIWQIPHFLAISIYRMEDYRSAGIKVFPLEEPFILLRRKIIAYTFTLVTISLLPYFMGIKSLMFLLSAILLGIVFTSVSLESLFNNKSFEDQKNWARRYFIGSIIYLPLLMFSLIFFK